MVRFFVSPSCLQGKFAVLTGDSASHAKVLRLKSGDNVVLCTGDGTDHICTISDITPHQVSLVVQSLSPSVTEPKMRCTLYMAFPKSDKLEHVIQKATELGAFEIVAFPSDRCVSRPDDRSLQKKLERWQKIAASAAEQSGRGQIPAVRVARSFSSAMEEAVRADFATLLYENEEQLSLRQALGDCQVKTVSLVTGPEGGFTEKEVSLAKDLGLHICTLGPRILRCETAPLCALSAVLYACGELE